MVFCRKLCCKQLWMAGVRQLVSGVRCFSTKTACDCVFSLFQRCTDSPSWELRLGVGGRLLLASGGFQLCRSHM